MDLKGKLQSPILLSFVVVVAVVLLRLVIVDGLRLSLVFRSPKRRLLHSGRFFQYRLLYTRSTGTDDMGREGGCRVIHLPTRRMKKAAERRPGIVQVQYS